MTNISVLIYLLLLVQSQFFEEGKTTAKIEIDEVKITPIIPKPNEVLNQAGFFKIDRNTTFIIPIGAEDISLAIKTFNEKIENATGFRLRAQSEVCEKNCISIEISPELPDEAYELNVTKNKVHVKSKSGAGVFYALQSIRQILPVAIEQSKANPNLKLEVPCCFIKDSPRFRWRGLHLDVGRHFFEVATVKKYIDAMATLKYNRFHWHLTEDQGWRIEIKKYPRLTTVGSKRKETLLGTHRDKKERYDGKPYTGFYTQEQIKEVVKYAAERFVTVVPEIEMPGHCRAAIAAYPELGCTGAKVEVGTRWGVFEEAYCSKDETFQFLEDVLNETMELFPSEYVHIGGDECVKNNWKKCQKCQKHIKDEGLKDELELQSYFVRRIERFLNSKGKKLIGWDEILEGGLSENATVMSWRGESGGIAAVKQKHDVIMTPEKYCYFNFYQHHDKSKEPVAMGSVNTLEHVYSYNPLPKELNESEANYVIGAQGNLWTEYIDSPQLLEYQAFPRAIALSEVLWTKPELKDFPDFKKRLNTLSLRNIFSH